MRVGVIGLSIYLKYRREEVYACQSCLDFKLEKLGLNESCRTYFTHATVCYLLYGTVIQHMSGYFGNV